MRPSKNDLMITYENEGSYRIYVRKRYLFFFYGWIPLTYQETECTDEKLLEFKSFQDATNFIECIT